MNKSLEFPIIEAKGLGKIYKDAAQVLTVLEALDFTVGQGELIAIQGASGSGKSSLLHCLGALDDFEKGEVYWQGRALSTISLSERAEWRNRLMGFVYQFHHLLPEFTALENVAVPLLMRRSVTVAQARERAAHALERVGLAARMQHKPAELSGGERQRVALARALVTEPACVLADEPTGNLDQKTAAQMMELILELNQTLKISWVIVTHDPRIAQQMQTTYELVQGQLLRRI